MKYSGKILALLMVLCVVIGAAGSYVVFSLTGLPGQTAGQVLPTKTGDNNKLSKVNAVDQLIQNSYFQDVDQDKLINGAIHGMISALDDPFSAYMEPKEAADFQSELSSSFSGIGATVKLINDRVTIVSPLKGSPADKAGLQANDIILEVNGKSLKGMSLTEAVNKIKGKKGTDVTLTIKRPNEADLTKVTVTRDTIPNKTVSTKTYKTDGETLGYLRIESFNEDTAAEFKKALNKLEEENIKGLVIDVRGNPGGYLQSVEGISDAIIPDTDKPVVQIKNGDGSVEKYHSKLDQKKPYPIVGLLDGGSASAAEILSAALHEAGGYPLVGTKSFGKGTVQGSKMFDDNSEIKLTIAKWLTPDGNWIHKKGIKPTKKVEMPEYFYTPIIKVDKGKQLEYDQTGSEIAHLQVMLKGLGFDPGRTDGYFSKQTKQAVIAFQKKNGLDPTGSVNSETAGKIDDEIYKAAQDPKNDPQLQTALSLLTDK